MSVKSMSFATAFIGLVLALAAGAALVFKAVKFIVYLLVGFCIVMPLACLRRRAALISTKTKSNTSGRNAVTV